jgi:nitrate/nitrite-specific signal transduction histidine kinase
MFTQTIEEERFAMRTLEGRSLDACRMEGHDLERAFSRMAEEIALPTTSQLRIIVEGLARTLRPSIHEQVCRIGRETLVTAFQQSRATKVEVELHFSSGYFGMRIRDNGCGIDPRMLSASRECYAGLTALHDRAERIGAQLKVLSRVASGTEIQLLVPAAVAFEPGECDGQRSWLLKLCGPEIGAMRMALNCLRLWSPEV